MSKNLTFDERFPIMLPQNMEVLHPSRKKIKAGDIFVFNVPKYDYVYGRVIKTDVLGGGIPKHNLVYIYRAFSKNKEIIPHFELRKENLLIPPLTLSKGLWLDGYFETIESKPIDEKDIWQDHCFEDSITYEDICWFDEYRNKLEKKTEPCGIYGSLGNAYVDELISNALDLPFKK